MHKNIHRYLHRLTERWSLWIILRSCRRKCVFCSCFVYGAFKDELMLRYECIPVCALAPKSPGSRRPNVSGRRIKFASYSAQTEATTRPLGEERGARRSGRGQSAVNFSLDRKLAESKRKPLSPFREEWLAFLSRDVGLRSLSDKDATDGLRADDHEWRNPSEGRPCLC